MITKSPAFHTLDELDEKLNKHDKEWFPKKDQRSHFFWVSCSQKVFSPDQAFKLTYDGIEYCIFSASLSPFNQGNHRDDSRRMVAVASEDIERAWGQYCGDDEFNSKKVSMNFLAFPEKIEYIKFQSEDKKLKVYYPIFHYSNDMYPDYDL